VGISRVDGQAGKTVKPRQELIWRVLEFSIDNVYVLWGAQS